MWRRGGLRHGIDVGDEGAGRVDDEARRDLALRPAFIEIHGVAVFRRRDRRHGAAVENIGTPAARIEENAQREPRVVGLAVVIVQHRA